MVLNKFYIHVCIRVTFIVFSGILLGILLPYVQHGYYYTLSGIVFLIAFQAWLLLREVNRTNVDLDKFFSAVHDHDSNIRFSNDLKDSSFEKLHARMNGVNMAIQHAKTENEKTSCFMQSLVEHVDVGLLSYDSQGKVEICNRAAVHFLGIQKPLHVESLRLKHHELYSLLKEIEPGHDLMYKNTIGDQVHHMLVKAIAFSVEEKSVKLVSFQDITRELDKMEVDSWQRLIRVLTHEIMNSISPVTSLTSVISGYFRDRTKGTPILPGAVDDKVIQKTLAGLNTIEETGKGLMEFVDKYRSLVLLPKPRLVRFSIESLFEKCSLLMESIIPKQIQIKTAVVPVSLILEADVAQIEQVIINLIKNAAEAMENLLDPKIEIMAVKDENEIWIQVKDNGSGIPPDQMENIFVPFFTTKENGSGIGLSLARQIMQNHNGSISVKSLPAKGATFTLKFQI